MTFKTICVTCGAVVYGLAPFPDGVQKAGKPDEVECIIECVCWYTPAELERVKAERIVLHCAMIGLGIWERAHRA